MKKYKSIIFFLAGTLLVACNNDTKMMISANPQAPVLSTPSHTSKLYNATQGAYILNKDSASSVIETFIASAADYGANTTVTYSLQIDKAGNNFAKAQTLATSTKPSIPVTVSQLNTPIASEGLLNATTGSVSNFDIRIMATIGNSLQTLYSNTVTIKVNPYPTYGLLYVPGNYQSTYPPGGNWNPANPNTILYSTANNGKYEGYLDMASSGFKFNEYPDWDHGANCWGAGSSSGTLSTSGGDIAITPGYYKFNVDVNAKTYIATAITKWGVIGSFNSWSTDVNMVFNATTKLWNATVTFASGDKFKIRANGAWDIAFGYDSASGKYTSSGGDIPVATAGTYTVTLDVRQYGKPGYNVILTKQ